MDLLPRCPIVFLPVAVLFLPVQNVSLLRRLPCLLFLLEGAGPGRPRGLFPPCPGSLWEQLGDRASGAVVHKG